MINMDKHLLWMNAYRKEIHHTFFNVVTSLTENM